MDIKSMIMPIILSFGKENIDSAISSITDIIANQENENLTTRFLVELQNTPKKDTPAVTQIIYTRNEAQKWVNTISPDYNKKPLSEIFEENKENIPPAYRMLLKPILPMIPKAFKNKGGGYIKILIYNEIVEQKLQTRLQVNTYDSENCNIEIKKYTFSEFLEMILAK